MLIILLNVIVACVSIAYLGCEYSIQKRKYWNDESPDTRGMKKAAKAEIVLSAFNVLAEILFSTNPVTKFFSILAVMHCFVIITAFIFMFLANRKEEW